MSPSGHVDESLSNDLSHELDRIIESGGLFVRNDGPAIKERMQQHGCCGAGDILRHLLNDFASMDNDFQFLHIRRQLFF